MTPPGSPFSALKHRNFRLLWSGQIISFSGSMMQSAAILWHVSLLVPPEKKALALGLVGLVRIIPIIFFSLVSGVVADIFDRRKLMLITQTGMMLTAGALAWLTFSGLHVVWPLYVLAAVSSSAGAFDGPARQSLIPNLVPAEDLANAIGLNTIMFQTASVVGPTLAGIVIAGLGIGWAYALNAVSFLTVIVALVAMRNLPRPTYEKGRPREVTLKAALEGIRFVFSEPVIRSTMLLDFFATFFSSATALLPIFAQDILHVGARGYGWLYAAPSIGSLVASVFMVRMMHRIVRRGRVIITAVVGYGIATVLFGFSKVFWLTFACLALTGVTDTVSTVLRNIVRQFATPDHIRGRMTSVNMIFFMGGPQLGELEAGLVAQWLGAPFSVVSGGVACLAATWWLVAKTPELLHLRRAEAGVGSASGEAAAAAAGSAAVLGGRPAAPEQDRAGSVSGAGTEE